MRAAIYVRVSTEEQAMRGLSLIDQRTVCEEWCKENGHEIVDIYPDAGISARKVASKRPQLQRLLDDVRAGKIDLVVFTKLDRWFRNVGQYFIVNEILVEHNVSWCAVLENHETMTAAGQFEVTIMLGVAQMEADNISSRIKFTFDQKRARGECTNRKAPLGLMVVDKKLQVNRETAGIARQVFDKYMSTRSVSQTARWLQEEHGIFYTYNGMGDLLSNHRYVESGIITQEDYDVVQRMRRERSARWAEPTKHDYLFSGMVRCGECGRKMRAGTSKGYIYYTCNNNYRANPCPNRCAMSERVIEKHLRSELLEKVNEYNEIILEQNRKTSEIIDISALQKKQERLADLYIAGHITKEKYSEEYQKIQKQLQVQPIKKKINQPMIESVIGYYEKISRDGKREIWSNTVSEIVIYKDRHIEFSLL